MPELSNQIVARISNGAKSFKSGNAGGKLTVFQNLNLAVPRGCLYSLLGSSDCGKTSTLSCLVGLLKLDSGSVQLFGNENVSSELHRVGYMPQEISLHDELTIQETLVYFAKLFCPAKISHEWCVERAQFLVKLLQLPKSSRIVGTLSGGQIRRVSFAVALIFEPELLILDEPTSGVDPLVRECIWNHLKWLTEEKHTTVLLTTHYVDEAQGSHMVGIMRNGRLIAEQNPKDLIAIFNATSLDDVFLDLCRKEEYLGITNCPNSKATNYNNSSMNICDREIPSRTTQRITQMANKHLIAYARNLCMLFIALLAPTISVFTICLGMKQNPHGLTLGVVNHDIPNNFSCSSLPTNLTSCVTDFLSCLYLDAVSSDTLKINRFFSREDALEAVQDGDSWGILYFPQNYSSAVVQTMMTRDNGESWNNSRIYLSMDRTSELIYSTILGALTDAHSRFVENLLKSCGVDPRQAKPSLNFLEPVVGNVNMTAVHFIGPSLALGLLFVWQFTVSVRLVVARRQGTLARLLAGGVKLWQFLASLALSEFVILLAQSSLIYTVLYYGFDIGVNPYQFPLNAGLSLSLYILQGISGLTCGLVLGLICNLENQAAMITVAVVMPLWLGCGILWPIEGMSFYFRKIAVYLPLTLPAEALRSLMVRHWGIENEFVWQGFLTVPAYILINLVLIALLIKLSKR